jgi:hypothetical protein
MAGVVQGAILAACLHWILMTATGQHLQKREIGFRRVPLVTLQ